MIYTAVSVSPSVGGSGSSLDGDDEDLVDNPTPVDPLPGDVYPTPVDPLPVDDGNDSDVSNVLTDIVNTFTDIDGLNSIDINDEEAVTNLIGIGNVDAVVGSSGTTTEVRLGDVVDTVGAIQGQWYNFKIANVNIKVRDD